MITRLNQAIQFLDNIKHAEVGRAIGEEGFYAELIGYHVEALNVAIKALEHPERNVVAVVPCGDTISRQAVLDVLDENSFTDSCIKVRQLPSVNPQEPKTGHWTHDGSHWKNRFICSECGYKLFEEQTNFCPNCGARMVEPQESDHKCHTCKHYTSGENDGSCGSYICKNYSDWESEGYE